MQPALTAESRRPADLPAGAFCQGVVALHGRERGQRQPRLRVAGVARECLLEELARSVEFMAHLQDGRLQHQRRDRWGSARHPSRHHRLRVARVMRIAEPAAEAEIRPGELLRAPQVARVDVQFGTQDGHPAHGRVGCGRYLLQDFVVATRHVRRAVRRVGNGARRWSARGVRHARGRAERDREEQRVSRADRCQECARHRHSELRRSVGPIVAKSIAMCLLPPRASRFRRCTARRGVWMRFGCLHPTCPVSRTVGYGSLIEQELRCPTTSTSLPPPPRPARGSPFLPANGRGWPGCTAASSRCMSSAGHST